jgi:zinc transporter ZupT
MEYLAYGLVTASATMAGGLWVASRPRVWLTEERLALMTALGGGLLAATLCFELLPEAVEHGGANAYFWLFAGIAAVAVFDRYLAPRLNFLDPPGHTHDHGHDHDHHDHGACAHDHGHSHGHAHAHSHGHGHGHGNLLSHGTACSALGCLLVCTFFDGIAMVASFAINVQVGIVVSIGLLLHLLPEGMMAATVVLAAGSTAMVARRAAIAIGVSLLLGVSVAAALGGTLGFMAAALPFTAGVIMVVVLQQLLPVAMRSRWGVLTFFGVACLMGVVERLVPHTH